MGDLEVCKWQFTAYVSFWLHYKFPTIQLHAGPTTFADQNTVMKDSAHKKKLLVFILCNHLFLPLAPSWLTPIQEGKKNKNSQESASTSERLQSN